jgi:hypothetical protein
VRKRNEKAKPLCIMSNDCVLSMFWKPSSSEKAMA